MALWRYRVSTSLFVLILGSFVPSNWGFVYEPYYKNGMRHKDPIAESRVMSLEEADGPLPCVMDLKPNRSRKLLLDSPFQVIRFNCSCPHSPIILERRNNESIYIIVKTSDFVVARPMVLKDLRRCINRDDCDRISVWIDNCDKEKGFKIEPLHIGRVNFTIEMIQYSYNSQGLKTPNGSLWDTKLLYEYNYNAVVTRRRRMVDTVFDVLIAMLAVLTSFAVGCLCDGESIKKHYKNPLGLIGLLVCQLLLMPTVAYGLATWLVLSKELTLSLLLMASIPGGGLGHLLSLSLGGEHSLSRASNAFCVILAVGTSPLWIFVLNEKTIINGPEVMKIDLYKIPIGLGMIMVPMVLGLLLQHFYESSAEAFLNWIIKPLLLLASILFGTLGVHINMYMFSVIDYASVTASATLPLAGFLLGLVAGIVTRQSIPNIKTMAAECSVSNCMVTMCILRFSLYQPEADIASALPIWGIFFAPVPVICTFITFKVIKTALGYMQINKDKEGNFSIASSLAQVTQVSALSTPYLVGEGSEVDDEGQNLIDQEKVTVL
ncbi:ileal sodium/bile acid cotransporter-like [Tubulanus polymorphus]|uniref:ileal sodium/bile acid cotransporter-like n=1 Tax=Tubulanus polymorphus TaxID=672921 RepID=UPI003DA40010